MSFIMELNPDDTRFRLFMAKSLMAKIYLLLKHGNNKPSPLPRRPVKPRKKDPRYLFFLRPRCVKALDRRRGAGIIALRSGARDRR
jgi:hypothetical protein